MEMQYINENIDEEDLSTDAGEKISDEESTPGPRFRCPCCGYYTLSSDPEYEICPVCFWEYDKIQVADPDYAGGANELSLRESRENYLKYGACEERYVSHVRKALPEEEPHEDQ